MKTKLPDLVIGDLRINPPIIQGGMGVRISGARLASAVSNTGALGVIASVGLGKDEDVPKIGFEATCANALREEIKKARLLTNKPLGVNIMFALTNYESLVNVAVEEGVDVILSGAGLPLNLPSLVKGKTSKLIPIVSSARAANIICKSWMKKYYRSPDALVVEGTMAGGHLGFSLEELGNEDRFKLDRLVVEVLTVVGEYEKLSGRKIPVIAAGGIFNGKDIAAMFKLGASGVQMATRFVCTPECDVAEEFKKEFLKAKKEDILIIGSPVGMPLRVIKNKLVEDIIKGKKIRFDCHYKCLKTCEAESVSYCIAKALRKASEGNFTEGFAVCGENAYRVDKIIPVKKLIEELEQEAISKFYE
jgi:NAD(P)H-dependent flavin oxidoreductase YrpB (nitropropane dioxygenase family)